MVDCFAINPCAVISSSFPSKVRFFIHLCVLFSLNIFFFICFKINNLAMFTMQKDNVGSYMDEGNGLRGWHVV